MPVPLIMPKFDMDQEKATIISWQKKEGERVQVDETVLVVETDKIAIDVPSPASGILAGICAQEGEVVPIAEVIAYILLEGEAVSDLPGRASPPPAGSRPTGSATPVAARMARELGLDLTQVPGTKDRLTRADVERYLARPPARAGRVLVSATPAARRLAREMQIDLGAVTGSGPLGRIQSADISLAGATRAEVERISPGSPREERPAQTLPLAGMRRTIAERMQSSFREAPHISLTVEVDVTQLEETRARLNERAVQQGDQKVSLTGLLVRIVAWALERQPLLNASLIGEQISLWQDINIGVATAVPEGLIVPVIHGANRLSVREIAEAIQDLTTRAREGKLQLADVQHGTFTISNLGMFGISQFRAIINPPESGILAVGAVVRRPVVINDRDEIAVRPMISLTLAADHRVVDGVVAARFLGDIVQAVKAPEVLLY